MRLNAAQVGGVSVPPARSYNAGRAGLVDGGLCTRRAVTMCVVYVLLAGVGLAGVGKTSLKYKIEVYMYSRPSSAVY